MDFCNINCLKSHFASGFIGTDYLLFGHFCKFLSTFSLLLVGTFLSFLQCFLSVPFCHFAVLFYDFIHQIFMYLFILALCYCTQSMSIIFSFVQHFLIYELMTAIILLSLEQRWAAIVAALLNTTVNFPY